MPALLAVLTVLLQVAYPLTSGDARDVLTVVTVLSFLATTLAHATATRGPAWALSYLGIAAGTGLLAEAVGVATGHPFGDYVYAGSLGPKVLGVPVVVPLAWAMFAYPCLLLGRRTRLLWGAAALVAWDLFLDPQMVEAGHWRWLDVRHAVPGTDDVPWSNTAGWALVAVVLLGLLALLPDRPADDRVPLALLWWTWGSSVLANLAFFGRPGTALVGGVALGLPMLRLARA